MEEQMDGVSSDAEGSDDLGSDSGEEGAALGGLVVDDDRAAPMDEIATAEEPDVSAK